MCRGAPAICSPSQASNKSQSMQAGQPASQPDPSHRGGGEHTPRGGGCCVCRRVFVCVCMVEICRKLMSLKEDVVAVATL